MATNTNANDVYELEHVSLEELTYLAQMYAAEVRQIEQAMKQYPHPHDANRIRLKDERRDKRRRREYILGAIRARQKSLFEAQDEW